MRRIYKFFSSFFRLAGIDKRRKKLYNKNMGTYEHKKEFTVKYCEVDFKDELKASTALSYMEEVACSSADELGFGYAYVKPRGYAFMVTNLCLEWRTPILLGETVCVKTWPTPPSHVIFGREYQFLTNGGEICLNASSRWCMIDRGTGKILSSKLLDNQDYSTYNTNKVLEGVQWKIPTFKREEGELRFSLKIAYAEYDHNMHVNNTRYADYCLNCFSIGELATMRLKRFAITYVKQCREGETLYFYRKRLEDGSYLVHGFNDGDELVTQSHITFA